ncbi:MAG: hypothetical protein ABSG46_12330 [Candidatus Binataceae bacterium]|jgi:hypothetical protein
MANDSESRGPRSSRTIAKPVVSSAKAKNDKSKADQAQTGNGQSGKTEIGLIAKVRKPIPPPTRVAEDERKYSRARERERSRRGK